MRNVADIMSSDILKIHRDKLVCEVEGLFVAKNVNGALVVGDLGAIVGVVTTFDVNRFDFTGGDPYAARAHEIANPSIISVPSNATVKEAAKKMLDSDVHHLVVMNDGEVVGILSSLDFVKLAVED